MHRTLRITHQQSERGSALIAVIGVMAVLALLTITLSALAISALGQTTSARAGVQSMAVAESAVNFGRSEIARGVSPCAIDWAAAPGTTSLAATVQQSVDGSTWAPCPATSQTKFVRIEATGSAVDNGVAGVSARDTSRVLALFDYKPGIGPVVPTGAGVYSFNKFAVDKATLVTGPVTLTGGGIIVREGDFVCTNPNGVVSGSIWVYGNLDLGQCEVTENAWVEKYITPLNPDIAGSVCSKSRMDDACGVDWTMPASPGWVDIDDDPATWLAEEDGLAYEEVTVPVNNCTIGQVLDFADIAKPNGRPVIIDAIDNCPGGISISGQSEIDRHIVLFARTYVIANNNSSITSDSTQKVWFITPDYVDDAAPSCPIYADGSTFPMGFGWTGSNRSFSIAGEVEAMLYTPCVFGLKNGSNWTGQLYVGGTDVQNNFNFTYSQVGIGGANLNTGEEFTETTPSVVLKSIRDLSSSD